MTDEAKKCRYCPTLITWSKTDGRWVPIGPDGEDHRDNCGGQPESGTPDSRGARSGLTGTDVRQIVTEELEKFGRAAGLLKGEVAQPPPEPDKQETLGW
jgi:hypothetical protein